MLQRQRSAYLTFLLFALSCAAQTVSLPRWGQAAVLVNDQLFVHGGKTDQFNEFSYTSAHTNNDLLRLDLSSSFDSSSPPWQYVSGSQNSSSSQGPTLAWHTLSAFNATHLLLFGGDGGPNSAITLAGQTNSAWMLDVSTPSNPVWVQESSSWANEPERRIHQAVTMAGGFLWMTGGEEDDSSGVGFSDHYIFDPATPSFTQLPTTNAPPDLYGHTSITLDNGTILVFGGFSQSQGQLISMSTIWAIDTTQDTIQWTMLSVATGTVPPGRRAFACVVLEGGQVLIQGGADAELQSTFSDGWILDTSKSPATWSNVSSLSQVGARRDHFAVAVGGQVVFGFGYGSNAGASQPVVIYDTSSGSIVSSLSSKFTPSQTTSLAPSGTNGPGLAPSANGTATGRIPGSTSSGHSSPDDPNDPNSSNGKKRKTAAIALAVVFSVIGAVVLIVILVAYDRRRRQHRHHHPFRAIGSDETGDRPPNILSSSSGPAEKLPMAGQGWFAANERRAPFALFNVGNSVVLGSLFRGRRDGNYTAGRQRVNMLADEDLSDLHVHLRGGGTGTRPRSGSSRSWWSSFTSLHNEISHENDDGRPASSSVADLIGSSVNSIRGFGSKIATGAGAGMALVRGTSDGYMNAHTAASSGWEKRGLQDPFSDEAVADTLRRPSSYISTDSVDPNGTRAGDIDDNNADEPGHAATYTDPFQDPSANAPDYYHNDVHHDDGEMFEYEESLTGGSVSNRHSIQSTLSQSSGGRLSAPLLSVTSHQSSSGPGSSAGSHVSPSTFLASSQGTLTIPSSDEQSGHARSLSGRPLTTSIIGAGSSPIQSISRSGTWWARLRRSSFTSPGHDQTKSPPRQPIEFKDPNPPPRLIPIEESSSSNSPEPPESSKFVQHGKVVEGGLAPAVVHFKTTHHEKSRSSLQTSGTADSAQLERLASGRVDVVQRLGSEHTNSGSTGSGSLDSVRPWNTAAERRLKSVTALTADSTGETASSIIEDEDSSLVLSPEFIDPEAEKRNRRSEPGRMTRALTIDVPPPVHPSSAAAGRDSVKRLNSRRGTVAARIAEYEGRSPSDQDQLWIGLSSPTRRDLRSPPQGEDKARTQQRGRAVSYGLTNRPDLFVANPDRSGSGSSDS